jgi:PAS domain-containing protein
LLRALNTGIAIFNPKTQLTFYNDAFVSLFPLDDFFLDEKPTLGEIMEILREKRRLPEQADFKLYKKQWTDRFTSLIAPHEELMHLARRHRDPHAGRPAPAGRLVHDVRRRHQPPRAGILL